MFKLCKAISNFQDLEEISLCGNHLPYFCVDAISSSKNLPKNLILSDTRMDDLSAYHILSKIIKT